MHLSRTSKIVLSLYSLKIKSYTNNLRQNSLNCLTSEMYFLEASAGNVSFTSAGYALNPVTISPSHRSLKDG